MLLLFALGGLQGFVGWWMVESGLETRVCGLPIPPGDPSRRRDHSAGRDSVDGAGISAAEGPAKRRRGMQNGRSPLSGWFICRCCLARWWPGLHAGLVYNTWPLDGWAFLAGATHSSISPWWINFFESTGLAQFDHRIGAYLVAAGAFSLWSWGRRAGLAGFARYSGDALLLVTARRSCSASPPCYGKRRSRWRRCTKSSRRCCSAPPLARLRIALRRSQSPDPNPR